MTAKEIWNYLVEHYNKNKSIAEEQIQRDWESFFADSELFGYSKIKGDVDAHRSLQIGSYQRTIPDIILRKDGEDLFVVELKRYSLDLIEEREDQLFSYMKLLRIPIGILVCEKIYIYNYDFKEKDEKNRENKVEIPFETDNASGITFIELFCKGNFSQDGVKNFIFTKKNFEKNIKKIREQIDSNFIKKLVEEYFIREYTEEEVKNALSGSVFNININERKENKPILPPANEKGGKKWTNQEEKRKNFWTNFNEYAFKNANFNEIFSQAKAWERHYYGLKTSSLKKCGILVSYLKDRLELEIYINKNKGLFDKFFLHKEEIESVIGEKLQWKREAQQSSRIILSNSEFDTQDESFYKKEFDWIMENAIKFRKAFSPYCQ